MAQRDFKRIQIRLSTKILEQVEMLSDLYGMSTNSLISYFIGQCTVSQVKLLDGFQDKILDKMVAVGAETVEKNPLPEVAELPEFLRTGKMPIDPSSFRRSV